MPDASPAKWHLGHTTWFFEQFVLAKESGYRPFHPQFEYIFNSYYETIGPRMPRAERGLLSRPSVDEVRTYRRHVDEALLSRWSRLPAETMALGIAHEEQHQELLLTDIKHALSRNPLRPAYRAPIAGAPRERSHRWLPFPGGLVEIGDAATGFSFDHERPRHRVFLEPFRLAEWLVSSGDFLAFMTDGGYERPELWLSDGWSAVERHNWSAPLYWESHDGTFFLFTLAGLRELDPAEPVCHVSYYEADAYARWAQARLPSEAEWEHAAARTRVDGNFVESGRLHPGGPSAALYGDCWQWTRSAYQPYPGFRPSPGAVGEYNGKFMCNQQVLRGGSCVSPARHLRASYRNFFPPATRWQFSGIRLARDA
jgi:ergothioneine biosynthesis protein EgtB